VITYAERVCFTQPQLKTLARAQVLVGRVADTWGNELRCHELARALRRSLGDFGLTVVDGHCGPVEHTWLMFGDGTILDLYVPGRLPAVQIVDSLVGTSYRPGPLRRDVRRSIVDKLVIEMRDRAD